MEHTIGGVSLRLEFPGPHPTDPTKRVNGCALTAPATWAAVNALVGQELPGVGAILVTTAPRIRGDMPAGTRINLVTAVAP